MIVVKSTVYAASVLREFGGNTVYWLERMAEVGVEQAAKEMRETYSKQTDDELRIQLETLDADIRKALNDLNEPFAAQNPFVPLGAS